MVAFPALPPKKQQCACEMGVWDRVPRAAPRVAYPKCPVALRVATSSISTHFCSRVGLVVRGLTFADDDVGVSVSLCVQVWVVHTTADTPCTQEQ